MRNATIAQVGNCVSSPLRYAWKMVYDTPVKIDTLPGHTSNPASAAVAAHVIRFARALHELERCDPKQAPGLSIQQLKALLFLVQSDGSTIKDLARALSLSEARASRLAEELTVSGHVVGDRDPEDRRQVRLQATAMGASKAKLVYGKRMKALETALDGVSERDMDAFLLVLDRIVVQLEDLAAQAAVRCEGGPVQ
jgi:DNA-binding MarR family transcriptional regulator